MMERDDERAQMRYAVALTEWGEAGGYEAEVHWDACSVAAFGIPYEQCRWRDVSTLSGGEQKRLVLESLLRGTDGVLLLDEPDNRSDERRVGTECPVMRVDLGGRRIIK